MTALPMVPHVDLAGQPFKPSRVLQQFAASRQAERRARQAAAEQARGMADLRRSQRASAGLPRLRLHDASMPQPAFASVSGVDAFGASSARQRRAFAAASGSDRLASGWASSSSSINADLATALHTLRARSRDWCMNTDAGERYVSLVQDNLIGSEPPRLQMRLRSGDEARDRQVNAAVESAWRAFCEAGACDLTGQLSFVDCCRAMVEAAARDGEFLARHVRDRQAFAHGYALQLLDVDRIDTARNEAPAAPGARTIRLGVELSPALYGRRTALYLQSAHPGDPGSSLAPRFISDRVDIANLVHGFVLRRPEQLRGYPWTAGILREANQLSAYQQYAVVAAKIGAAKMGFYVTDKDVLEDPLTLEELRNANGELVQDVEAGMLEALPPGVTFQSFDPDYPHANYGAFVTDTKRGLATGLNVAHHNLSGDMTGVNYSSARIAELAERRFWRARQRWFIGAFVRPVFRQWLECALVVGAVRADNGQPLPGTMLGEILAAARFQPPGWAWVDPQADIKAAIEACGGDLRSLRQVCDENGVDLDDVLSDNAELLKRYEELGLPVPVWLQRSTPGAQPAAAPADKPDGKPADGSDDDTTTDDESDA